VEKYLSDGRASGLGCERSNSGGLTMTSTRKSAIALACMLALAVAPALAEKPEWAGQGKGQGKGKNKKNGGNAVYFNDSHRGAVSTYYHDEFRRGNCPPGLAKKHNGCLPPGQAKKQWQVGQPLPAGVVIYDVPPALVVKLGPPPAGQKYVRVAADILLIAVGTSMVVDAISDLGKI
jgi:Ni/Co efflux regulator RcnB